MEGLRRFSPTIVQAEVFRNSLRKFARESWPHFEPAKLVWNWHLEAICDHLSYVSMGDIRFLMINIGPRTSKSSILSVVYPVWEWLQDPTIQFLTASYSLQLSTRDALRSRRLLDSPWFKARWGHEFRFAFDEKLKRSYSNDKNGRRIAIATESTTTGEGGNRLIVDDPHNATEVESDVKRLGTHDWWDHAMSSRLNQPDKDAWILGGQRTHEDDLFGHVWKTHDRKDIVRLVLPTEHDPKRRQVTVLPRTSPDAGKVVFRDPRVEAGELLNPARLGPGAVARLRKIMKSKYTLQYQQDTKGVEGDILPRSKWRKWPKELELPECEYIFDVYDTAFEEGQENDYTARTTWGVFRQSELVKVGLVDRRGRRLSEIKAESRDKLYLILIGAWRDKIGFPALRKEVLRRHRATRPAYTLIERNASGISLIQECRRKGVGGLRGISYAHGSKVKIDKVERAEIASVVLDDDLVYYVDRLWAEEVIDECASFPNGTNDDYVDTVVNAWQWVRRSGELGDWEREFDDGETVRLFKRSKDFHDRRGYG